MVFKHKKKHNSYLLTSVVLDVKVTIYYDELRHGGVL